MDKQNLQLFREQLEQERSRILEELSAFAHRNPLVKDGEDFDTAPLNFGDDEEENASEIAQYVDNLSVEDDLEKSLRDIERALKSIEDGTYGLCKYCKGPIDFKRLQARPDSSSCIECKRLFTKEVA
jgi:DnaK suppressor protein